MPDHQPLIPLLSWDQRRLRLAHILLNTSQGVALVPLALLVAAYARGVSPVLLLAAIWAQAVASTMFAVAMRNWRTGIRTHPTTGKIHVLGRSRADRIWWRCHPDMAADTYVAYTGRTRYASRYMPGAPIEHIEVDALGPQQHLLVGGVHIPADRIVMAPRPPQQDHDR